MSELLFKIIDKNGNSCSGGNMAWSLPKRLPSGKWVPGDWHSVDGEIRICYQGFHLTDNPVEWMRPDRVVYVAVGRGDSRNEGGQMGI